jgi:hypothetical protein
MTVAGLTVRRWSRQEGQRCRNQTQRMRCGFRRRGGGVGLESDVELVAENHAPMKSRQPVFYIRRAAIRMQATPERARRV